MQYVDRSRVLPPSGLVTNSVIKENIYDIGQYLALDPERRAQTRPPTLANISRAENLKDSLYELFNGRCAFCESKSQRFDIHRFRPSSNAIPMNDSKDAPLYYLWLSWAWQNFYLACPRCNQLMGRNFEVTGKRMPVPSSQEYQNFIVNRSGEWPQWPPKENSLLLDPCQVKSFAPHFEVSSQGGFNGLTRKGKATIKLLNLDDNELMHRRMAAYAIYKEQLLLSIELKSEALLSDSLNFSQIEFGGSWYLLLRRVASLIEDGEYQSLTASMMNPFFQSMFLDPERSKNNLYRAFEDAREFNAPQLIMRSLSRPNGELFHVKFRHFKSLEDMELDLPAIPEVGEGKKPEARALLLLGENAAGKSTILEGIALALISGEGRKKLKEKVKLRWPDFILSPALLSGDNRLSPDRAEVVLIQNNRDSNTLVLRKGGRCFSTLHGEFNVGPVFAYGAFRQYRLARVLYSADKTVRNLFDGSMLGNPQSWLLSLSDVNFNRVVAALREVLSIEGEFEVIQRNPQTKECAVITTIDGIKTSTPLNVASSGFRTVLAMVCDIMQGLMDERIAPKFEGFEYARGVVLIDEVEAHLHPRWKMQIMGGLRRALPGMTFIVTTHDPLCLRGMYDGEVRVIQRTLQADTGSRASMRVETLSVLPDITKLRVDQLLTSDFFQLDSTDEPRLDRLMAQVADLLAKRERGDLLEPEENEVVENFERDIASAMPVGTTEAHRLVQAAVAEYLKERRQISAEKIRALQERTRSSILDILRGVVK